MTDRVLPSRGRAALAGAAAGAAAIGVNELVAGLFAGAPSFVAEIGGLVIDLQPPGAKQFVVDLFGTADKAVFSLLIVVVAVIGSALLGVVARNRFELATVGFVVAGLAAAAIAILLDPLVNPVLGLLSALASVATAILVLRWLLGLAAPAGDPAVPMAEMPDWSRRRFLGTSLGVVAGAAMLGIVGRFIGQPSATPTVAIPIPDPLSSAPPLPPGSDFGISGLSPIVTPNGDFYRIDTSLLTPQLDVGSWRLTVAGMVDQPLQFTYDQLLAMPLHEQYVTIACVSNEVGGDLVGNARWSGVRLRDVLNQAGVQAGATQVVGRAYDGWTCGFPTDWVMTDEREALIVVAMNGATLPAEHGFPARLIVPGLFGYVSATKWLTQIELTTWDAFDAYWVPLGWAKEGPILTQSRIDLPRAGSTVPAGVTTVAGVAWAPDRGIRQVEVQVDDGAWQAAELSTEISDATWVQWRVQASLANGSHQVRVRATDGSGVVQEERSTPPPPDGARGYHTVAVSAA